MREYIEANKSKEEEQNEFIMGIVTPIVIFPFFMLITLVVQMVGAEINEEKSTNLNKLQFEEDDDFANIIVKNINLKEVK